MGIIRKIGSRVEEGGYSTTSEEEHQHFCEECGGIWSHEDEGCPGPRFGGRATFGMSYTCPMCTDEA